MVHAAAQYVVVGGSHCFDFSSCSVCSGTAGSNNIFAPSCFDMQDVHLKNKGSLPEEAVKPVSTIGKPFKTLTAC